MDYAKQQSTARRSERQVESSPSTTDVGGNQAQVEALPELDLGEATLTLDSAAADLDAAIGSADPLDPFDGEAAWSGATAERWRGLALGLCDARARFDGQNSPSTPFGQSTEKDAIGGMAGAIENVEATAMGLETLEAGFVSGGAVLQVADEAMQVSLGVLERRGWVQDGPTGGALLDEGLKVGEPSQAGEAFSELPLRVDEVMAAQMTINTAWSAVRATAIEASAGADTARKAEIEAALAYVDSVLGAVASVRSFDPKTLSSRTGEGIGTLGDLLAGQELARLQANIDAIAGHGASLRRAGETEQLQAALKHMANEVEELQGALGAATPSSTTSLNGRDQTGTSMADARASQATAADVVRRIHERAADTRGRMKNALAASLFEPARSVLHDRGRTGRDAERLATIVDSLASRRAEHAEQVSLIEEA